MFNHSLLKQAGYELLTFDSYKSTGGIYTPIIEHITADYAEDMPIYVLADTSIGEAVIVFSENEVFLITNPNADEFRQVFKAIESDKVLNLFDEYFVANLRGF